MLIPHVLFIGTLFDQASYSCHSLGYFVPIIAIPELQILETPTFGALLYDVDSRENRSGGARRRRREDTREERRREAGQEEKRGTQTPRKEGKKQHT